MNFLSLAASKKLDRTQASELFDRLQAARLRDDGSPGGRVERGHMLGADAVQLRVEKRTGGGDQDASKGLAARWIVHLKSRSCKDAILREGR
eukprot:5747893-Pleurochrysis_carterae.AAC.1